MNPYLFIQPLNGEALAEIATTFPAFQNVESIRFEANKKYSINFGCFSAQITDRDALTKCLPYPCFCIVKDPNTTLDPTNSILMREYLVCVLQIPYDARILTILECDSATGLARPISEFTFDGITTAGLSYQCSFIILIPRKDNDRKTLIGTAITREGNHLWLEFKRDGKTMPALN